MSRTCDLLLSGCDMVTTLMNAQQLHMIKAVKTSAEMREALSRLHPLLRSYWLWTASGRWEIILSEDMVGFSSSSAWPHPHVYMDSTKT